MHTEELSGNPYGIGVEPPRCSLGGGRYDLTIIWPKDTLQSRGQVDVRGRLLLDGLEMVAFPCTNEGVQFVVEFDGFGVKAALGI